METSQCKRPTVVPVCERCRHRRQKCDITDLTPCNGCIGSGSECLISDLETQTSLPRTYIRSLEEQAKALRRSLQLAKTQPIQDPATRPTPQDFSFPISPGAASDSLIDNLFSHSEHPITTFRVKSLVQDLGQVSLSALSAPAAGQPHTAALQRLILSVAAATPLDGDHRSNAVPLPDISIAQRVCVRYCQDLLPSLPYTTTAAVLNHLRAGYNDSSPYSMFLIATTLATTAVFLSPASAPNAVGLYRTGLAYLELWFKASPEADMLQYLGAAVALAQFASIAGKQYADAWGLTGLAIRVAVDLGLHKLCETDRKQRLFWAAYSLDRRQAMREDLPVAVSDGAVSAELPDTLQFHPFKLYQIISGVHSAGESTTGTELDALKGELKRWDQERQSGAVSSSRILQDDYQLAAAKLQNAI